MLRTKTEFFHVKSWQIQNLAIFLLTFINIYVVANKISIKYNLIEKNCSILHAVQWLDEWIATEKVFGQKYCIKERMVKELVRNQVVCRVFSYLLVTFPLLNSRGILKKVELAQVKQGKLLPCRGHKLHHPGRRLFTVYVRGILCACVGFLSLYCAWIIAAPYTNFSKNKITKEMI